MYEKHLISSNFEAEHCMHTVANRSNKSPVGFQGFSNKAEWGIIGCFRHLGIFLFLRCSPFIFSYYKRSKGPQAVRLVGESDQGSFRIEATEQSRTDIVWQWFESYLGDDSQRAWIERPLFWEIWEFLAAGPKYLVVKLTQSYKCQTRNDILK